MVLICIYIYWQVKMETKCKLYTRFWHIVAWGENDRGEDISLDSFLGEFDLINVLIFVSFDSHKRDADYS